MGVLGDPTSHTRGHRAQGQGQLGQATEEQALDKSSGLLTPRPRPPLPAKWTQIRPEMGPQKVGERTSPRLGRAQQDGVGAQGTLRRRECVWAGLGGGRENDTELLAEGTAQAKPWGSRRLS